MWMYIQQQRLINDLENLDFHSDFFDLLRRSVLTVFATCGQKRRFLNVFKVGLKLFKTCFSIVFGLKRPTSNAFLAPEVKKRK